MVQQNTLLVMLVRLVDRIPPPSSPLKRGRGRPPFYPDQLFFKALVIMIIRHLHSPYELLTVLAQPTPEMQTLRLLMTEHGRFPERRTWERRLHALPAALPAQLGALGRYLVQVIQPWANRGRAAVWDSTVLRSKGRVWHKKDREVGEVPHTQIDTDAHWTKSGWHGWVYGYKLHVISAVADAWIPLVALLTPANIADTDPLVVGTLSPQVCEQVRFMLGDRHYDTEEVRRDCRERGRILVAPRYGGRFPPYPHSDDGVEVRRVFHKLRSVAIENFNEHFKSIFDVHGPILTKGFNRTTLFVLGAVFVYQLALLHRFEQGLPLNRGLKPFLKAA